MNCDGVLTELKTKAVILQFLIIILVTPLTIAAQELETVISADQITVQPDKSLKAKGNVVILRGDVSIRAAEMTVIEETNKIELQEITEFSDGKSLKLTGENAILSDDLSAGIINAAQVLIEDTLRIRAKGIEIKNGTVHQAESIDRITSCEECEDGLPFWYFTASSATNDVQNKNIIYRDVTLRVRGFPIGYIPFLQLPNPNVDRAGGFLIPGLTITSNLGVGMKLPYFIPIGHSRDLLLTPYISPKTKTIEYRYRQKFSNGDFTIKGALSQDDISNKGIRSYYEASGDFELAYAVKLEIDAGQTNDDTYLDDYSYGSDDDLYTDISLGKIVVNQERLFAGDLNYVRDKKDDSTLEEFFSISGMYKKHLDQNMFPGNLFFEAEVNSALNVADGNKVRRPPSLAATEIRYINDRNLGPVKILGQSFSRLTSFVNSENIESLQEEFTLQFGASSVFSIPLYQEKIASTHQLSPKFMLSYNGQEGSIKGDAFIGEEQLSAGNIYAGKKIASSSESELGFSVSSGFDYRINWNDGRALDFWLAGMWLEDATNNQDQNIQLQPKTTYYISGFNYQSLDALRINGDTMLDNDGQILNANLSSKLKVKDLNLESRYEFIDAQTDERINENLEAINLSTSYTGFKNFNVSAIRRYDLSEDTIANSTSSFGMNFTSGFWNYKFSQAFDRREAEKTTVSAIYNDDCTRVSISLENDFNRGNVEDSVQSLLVMIQLKPFASFSVPGY